MADPRWAVKAPPGRGELEFRYSAIGFRAPERVGFKYMLEGFDQDWVEAGARRAAYYTNIPPGSYRFRVTARNAGGAWNTAGATFPFVLAPHFYQTAWFSAMCFVSVAGVAAAADSARTRRLRASEKLLARRVEERTTELPKEIVRTRAGATGSGQGQGSCRTSQPRQKRVSGQHEP